MARSATYPPGVHVELVDPPPRVDPGRVDVAAFVVVCERGPLDIAVRLSSWQHFEDRFGTFIPNGLGAYAVKAFFDNGGSVCHVVRVAAPARETTLAGVQPPSRSVSVVADLDGIVPGAAATIARLDRIDQHLVVAVDPATDRVTWDRPLHPDLAPGGPALVRVATGAGVAAAELVDAAGVPVLRVSASGPGGFGDRITVRVGYGRRSATTSRMGEPSVGVATPVERIDGFVVGSLVRVTQSAPAPVERLRVVAAVDATRRVLTWDTPLTGLDLTAPVRCETDTFTLSVFEAGQLREIHEDLVLVTSHPRAAVPTVVAGSRLVRVQDLTGGVPRHPVPDQPAGAVSLCGGRDGTAALTIDDLVGDELAGIARGMAVLADLDEPAALAMPDLVAEPTAPVVRLPPEPVDPCLACAAERPPDRTTVVVVEAGPAFAEDRIARAQQSMIEHCERRGDRIALLDPPAGGGPLDVGALRGWRARFDSSYAALHAPWLKVVDPLAAGPARQRAPVAIQGALRRVPPSGHVAGLLARVDADVGPWQAPANRDLRWAVDLDTALDGAAHALLNGDGVSVLRVLPGRGVVAMGARTVTSDVRWYPLSVRRLFLHVTRALRAALAWTVFEPADGGLDRLMGALVAGYAEGLYEGGALVGDRAEEAFVVRVGLGDRQVGQVIVVLGLAAARPNELILLRVSRTDDRLELTEMPERTF